MFWAPQEAIEAEEAKSTCKDTCREANSKLRDFLAPAGDHKSLKEAMSKNSKTPLRYSDFLAPAGDHKSLEEAMSKNSKTPLKYSDFLAAAGDHKSLKEAI